jgi:hypothetical protein
MNESPAQKARRHAQHDHLFTVLTVLPTDYTGYGGEVDREALWAADQEAPDCSCGCRWALELPKPLNYDWLVCVKPGGPRRGLLTWEHMAGVGCFEPESRTKWWGHDD